VGYSVGFIRGWLALWTLVALFAIVLGGANELLDLGLFSRGYPVLGDRGGGYGGFAVQAAIVAIAATSLSLLLERRQR
jgi:hypothetical protein